MSNRKIFAGIITLIAAGAVVGLVLSTNKGRKTSSELWKKGNRLTKDLKEKFNDFVDQIQDKVQTVLK
jgi:gas vesicle protein